MMALAWTVTTDDEDEIYVALSRGGGHFQIRRVDAGTTQSLAFSKINRLHLVYEQDGQILYRTADQGSHPADSQPILVEDVRFPATAGQNPQVVVDELNWAHVIYEQEGSLYQAKHLSGERWLTQFIAYGSEAAIRPFYNEREVILYGIPTGTSWFGLLLAAPYNGQLRLFRYLSWFNLWEQVAAFPIPAGEELSGPAGLDYLAIDETEAWVYAAWVTHRPNPVAPQPDYQTPIFEAVNPLYPNQIANPEQIYEGLNAVRWRSAGDPFSAGLYQTVVVPTAGALTLTAFGLTEAAPEADISLRIGLDPAGGTDPQSPTIIWSEAGRPDTFSEFSVSSQPAGNQVTIFLESTLSSSGLPATVIWDLVTLQDAAGNEDNLNNGRFEAPFTEQDGQQIPAGWTAYEIDPLFNPPLNPETDTIWAAWSADGGSSWSNAQPVAANQNETGATTGAIRPLVFPYITIAMTEPTVGFVYIYESGDPPAGSRFLRFGRPVITLCPLGTTECALAAGTPLLPAAAVRPVYELQLARDPFDPSRALLAWDSLQTDYQSRDILRQLSGRALRRSTSCSTVCVVGSLS